MRSLTPHIHPLDRRTDGGSPSPLVLSLLTTPVALRARAAIRAEIAKQDLEWRDTLAYQRNVSAAREYVVRADEAERP